MLDSALFGFLAVIHVLPAIAAIAPKQISRLYGVESGDGALLTLLQHRAVLLGLVGLGFVIAAVRPETIGWHAWLLGAASMVSFLVVAAFNSELGGRLRKIAIVDVVGLVPLTILFFRQPWAQSF